MTNATNQDAINAAVNKFEAGDILTAEELALLSPALQQAYADDMAEQAEHDADMAELNALLAS